MVLGFNHNVMYKGELFHVQTEDSGVAIPHIITLLYKGGVILCSQKTSYADILKINSLETVVEELMKEQHKEMLRRLKSGEFDERAFPSGTSSDTGLEIPPPLPADAPGDELNSLPPECEKEPSAAEMELKSETPSPHEAADVPAPEAPRQSSDQDVINLDDIVSAFFAANEK